MLGVVPFGVTEAHRDGFDGVDEGAGDGFEVGFDDEELVLLEGGGDAYHRGEVGFAVAFVALREGDFLGAEEGCGEGEEGCEECFFHCLRVLF